MPQIKDLMDEIVSLSPTRGLYSPAPEIYGSLANSLGLQAGGGVELRNNIKQLWWDRFVHRRDDV